jgi:hypothetical protein
VKICAPVTLAIGRGRDWTLDALWLLIVGGVSSAWCLTAASVPRGHDALNA